ncbi:S-layer homology domain-containing protein [Paenibacillus sepulcri]|uniref:S-layer homology domain-containing protein n=1 Tax=Paenibacillus sepulcri TaxID=359917 RepID=A0ABS7BZ03_9BACL|nr:S-layer homology domain-containing protein [Paenibacillus sepulcri]
MKLRKFSLILIVTLCLSLVPAAVFASSTAVALNEIAAVEPGGSVVIAGTSTLNEVIIQVLRPNNATVYYDIVQVNGGQFSSSFTLANSETVGTYKVIAGQADQTDSKDFVVKAVDSSGGGNDGDDSDNGDNGDNGDDSDDGDDGDTGGNGPVGTITPPSSPAPAPAPASGKPITPAKSNAEPVKVDTSKNTTVSSTAADGRVTTTVTQDSAALADALAKAAGQDNHGDAPIVFISFNNPAGEGVQFNIASSVLAAAALNAPDTIISLQTNDGEYSLPLRIIDFAALAQSLGTTDANISIQVNISPASTDLNARIKESAMDIAASQLGGAIEFSVIAAGNGKTVELNHFGSTYVDRNIELAISEDDTATVVLYDPSTGQFSFVPAVFEKQTDNLTRVTFKRNGNSVYTVLSFTKTFHDVSKHWAKADIELLASKLVVKGVTDSSFAPDSSITRAEFAALLVRSLGLSLETASADFADVKSSDWFAGAIGAAVQAKLVDGFTDNTFKPNDTINREQMAVMVARAIKAAGKTIDVSGKQNELLAKFQDKAAISSWAQAAVAQSVETNIITGMTNDTFVPLANASRAQAATMLKRFMQAAHFIN